MKSREVAFRKSPPDRAMYGVLRRSIIASAFQPQQIPTDSLSTLVLRVQHNTTQVFIIGFSVQNVHRRPPPLDARLQGTSPPLCRLTEAVAYVVDGNVELC
jgi:hypothetical protein